MFGLMVGSFICGYCSDRWPTFTGSEVCRRFGRKTALLGSMVVSTLASLAGAFMPGYWSYLALRSGQSRELLLSVTST